MSANRNRKKKNISLLNVTLKRDLPKAMDFHQTGKLEEAESLYRRLFRKYPKDVDLLHFYGLYRFQQGDTAKAIAMLRTCIRLNPDYAAAINNLGNMLKEEGATSEAESMYLRALDLEPRQDDAMVNLGVLARKRNATAESEEWYRKALSINSGNLSGYTNLCSLLSLEGRTEETVLLLEKWLVEYPDNETAKYLLAAHTGEGVPAQSNSHYIKQHFNQFSDSFDDLLNTLKYQAPQLVGEISQKLFATDIRNLHTLDAGCGTGLCGEYLQGISKNLVGIDLSGGMLALAEKTGWYDSLLEVEIIDYLGSCDTVFDLIVSADTICYFGALGTLFNRVESALTADGKFIFTVEAMPESSSEVSADTYVLNPHGRYSHKKRYLEDELDAAGLRVLEIDSVQLRMQQGEPVMGYLVVCCTS